MNAEKAYSQIQDAADLLRVANRLLVEVARSYQSNEWLEETCIKLNITQMHLDLAQNELLINEE